MEKSFLKSRLFELMGNDYIYCEAYQDKYYICKSIREKIPDLTEDEIYHAIDEVNKKGKSPVKSSDFIKIFTEKISE